MPGRQQKVGEQAVAATGCAAGHWDRWCQQFDWVRRCVAYDEMQDRARQAAARREAESMGERYAQLAGEALAVLGVPVQVLRARLDTLAGRATLEQLCRWELLRLVGTLARGTSALANLERDARQPSPEWLRLTVRERAERVAAHFRVDANLLLRQADEIAGNE